MSILQYQQGINAMIYSERLANNELVIYDAEAPIAITYEKAIALRDALNEYIALGEERIADLGRATEYEYWHRNDDKPMPAKEAVKTPGYVYLLSEINGPHFKIGRTIDPDNRMKVFTIRLPYKVEYECLIETEDMYTLESELHERFAAKRVDGEWFALDAQDVQYIKSLVGDPNGR